MKIISWQYTVNDHQAFMLDALNAVCSGCLKAYELKENDPIRVSQGWINSKIASLDITTIAHKFQVIECIKLLLANRNSIHIFSGPFESIKLMFCIFLCNILRLNYYIISEPYSIIDYGYFNDKYSLINKLKRIIRPYLYKIYNFLLLSNVSGLFCISDLARNQYIDAGVKAQNLYPFGYFVPRTNIPLDYSPTINKTGIPRFIFLGSLIPRKGISLLIEVAQALHRQGFLFKLDIYGPKNNYFIDCCEYISYCGIAKFGQTQNVISEYDLLILPSLHDGWGVVINEALASGVPILASNAVGAGHVAKKLGAGLLFHSNSFESLKSNLLFLLNNPNELKLLQSQTAYAFECLSPNTGANFIYSVISAKNNLNSQIWPL